MWYCQHHPIGAGSVRLPAHQQLPVKCLCWHHTGAQGPWSTAACCSAAAGVCTDRLARLIVCPRRLSSPGPLSPRLADGAPRSPAVPPKLPLMPRDTEGTRLGCCEWLTPDGRPEGRLRGRDSAGSDPSGPASTQRMCAGWKHRHDSACGGCRPHTHTETALRTGLHAEV